MSTFPELDPNSDERQIIAPSNNQRSHGRQIALQALYEIDSVGHPPLDVLNMHIATQQPKRKAAIYAVELVDGVLENRGDLDEMIARYAPEFPPDQLAVIDRNILRIALYEFAIGGQVPVGVSIDEAVTLAKYFGSDQAPAFINGVLGSASTDPDRPTPQRDAYYDDGDADDDPTS